MTVKNIVITIIVTTLSIIATLFAQTIIGITALLRLILFKDRKKDD